MWYPLLLFVVKERKKRGTTSQEKERILSQSEKVRQGILKERDKKRKSRGLSWRDGRAGWSKDGQLKSPSGK